MQKTIENFRFDAEGDVFIDVGGNVGLWSRELYDLYKKAYTPWEWHEILFKKANELGMDAFSTPFDTTSVERSIR